jgi:hypothetical protein
MLNLLKGTNAAFYLSNNLPIENLYRQNAAFYGRAGECQIEPPNTIYPPVL